MALLNELLRAARNLLKTPRFTALAVSTLAVGMAAAVVIFSLINALLLRPLPYAAADALVQVVRIRAAGDRAPVSGPDFADFQRETTTLSGLAFYSTPVNFNMGGMGEARHVVGARVSPNLMQLLGVVPLLGTDPTAGVKEIAGNEIIVGSHFWREALGGEPKAVGRLLRVDGKSYRVAAVVPSEVLLPAGSELWIPIPLTASTLGHRAYHQFYTIGRLRPDTTAAMAQTDLARVAAALEKRYPDTDRHVGVDVVGLREQMSKGVRPALRVMSIAVVFLLLISCSNVANLLLVRAAQRQREFAIRRAIGATMPLLVRQLVSEGILLAAIAAAVGLVLAYDALLAVNLAVPQLIARTGAISIDGFAVAFATLLTVATGVAFGLAPLATAREAQAGAHAGLCAEHP